MPFVLYHGGFRHCAASFRVHMATGNNRDYHVLVLPSFYSDPEKPVSGIFFKEQAVALQRAGMRVGVAYVEPRRLRSFRLSHLKKNHFQMTEGVEAGVTTLRLRGWNLLLQYDLGGLLWARMTKALVNRYIALFGRPDVIHAHNTHWAGYAAYLVSKSTGIPYVITEHSSSFLMDQLSPLSLSLAGKVFRDSSSIIGVSSAICREVARFSGGNNAVVIPNVVDTEYFSLPEEEPATDTFVFLAVAQLNRNKGFDVLIRAFAARFRDQAKVRLVIGGDGPEKEALAVLAACCGISDKVRFLGALSRDGVRSAMWNANALVVSSHHETFGVVLIEALSTGLPVIATKCGGPEDIVTPEVGILVEPGDVEQLVDALGKTFLGPKQSRRLFRARAMDYFSESTVSSAIRDVYHSVLENKQTSTRSV
jgi:L-malate glycosyltransferase